MFHRCGNSWGSDRGLAACGVMGEMIGAAGAGEAGLVTSREAEWGGGGWAGHVEGDGGLTDDMVEGLQEREGFSGDPVHTGG